MDMCRLRYVGDAPAAVPVLAGHVKHPDGTVMPECIVDFPGRIIPNTVHDPDDCFLVEFGNPPQVRAFPTSLWRNETPDVPVKKSKE